MEFKIMKKENENIHKYPTDDFKIAQKFSQQLKNELGDFIMGTIIFGSSARRQTTKESDIDVLVVSNDISFQINDALVESYRLIVENIIGNSLKNTKNKFKVVTKVGHEVYGFFDRCFG